MKSLASIMLLVALASGCVMPNVNHSGNPFGGGGYRVMIVHESGDLDDLTPEQEVIVFSTAAGSVRHYCELHCAQNNNDPDFRILDPDSPLDRDDPCFTKAKLAAEKKGLKPPYMAVGNGRRGWLGPLPPDTQAALAILKPLGSE